MNLLINRCPVLVALILVLAAVCPARAEVVAGYPSEFPSSGVHGPDYLLGQKLNVPEQAMVKGVGIIYKSANPGKSSQVGIYSDNSGAPGTLLAQTATFSQANGAVEAPLLSPIELSGDIWFMVIHQGAGNTILGESSSGAITTYYKTHTFGSSLPGTYVSGLSYDDTQFNYYLTGTIPEPCTAAILCIGAAGIMRRRRRRLRRN